MEQQKKTVWDFLDQYLPPAVGIYGKLRQETTGIDPFAQKQEELPIEDVKVQPKEEEKSNKTLLIVGGVIVLGIATYFLTRKLKKSGQKLL